MLMIVFGAGASFDSVPRGDWENPKQVNPPFRPPLAAELFSKRPLFDQALGHYSECVPLVGELRGAVASQEPVEEALQRYAEFADAGNIRLKQQLMALRFYLSSIIKTCGEEWLKLAVRATNYATLINVIDRFRADSNEDVLLVTFNYDAMLEDALTLVVGHEFELVDDYVFGESPYRLVKPHGSVTWKRLVRHQGHASDRDLIGRVAHYRMTSDVLMWRQSTDLPGVPAIAVPTLSKSLFECPDDHAKRLKQLLPNVDRLLVIGWRAQERSFLELLETRDWGGVSGLVVCEDRAHSQATVDALQLALPDANLVASDSNGFTGLVRNESLLRQAWDGSLDALR